MNPEFQPQMSQMNTDEPAAEKHLRPSVPSAAKKESAPKISVIVPVYKVEKYLPECIESVLAQTFTDFELILVDDGSPDNSGAICDAYAARDPRIRVFHKENGGVSSARNLGLDHSRGEWIAFVDSDDTVGEKYLEHLWGDGPAAGTLVVSGFIWIDEKGRVLLRKEFPFGTTSVYDAFRDKQLYCFGFSCSKLYDARIVAQRNLRFDLEINRAEDMLFMADYLRFAVSVSFREYSEDYYYLFREGSLTKCYEPVENAFKLFLRGRNMFKNLGFEILHRQESFFLKKLFFRSINSLYSSTSRERKKRIEILKVIYNELNGNEFSSVKCSIRESLFLRGDFILFDFMTALGFCLRNRVLTPVKRIVFAKKPTKLSRKK